MRFLALLSALLLCNAVQGWSLFGGGDSDEAENEEFDEPSRKIIGARVETCRGCKLNYLPKLRSFIDGDLANYKAVELKFIQGAAPEIMWLNEFGQVISTENIEQYDTSGMAALLKRNDITRKTPKPIYREQRFKPTKHCLAFRGADQCNPKEPRVMSYDSALSESIAGNCQCRGGLVLPVSCGTRNGLTCQSLCEEVMDGEDVVDIE